MRGPAERDAVPDGIWAVVPAPDRMNTEIVPMDRYLDELTFRSNHRQMENAMFDLLIGSIRPSRR